MLLPTKVDAVLQKKGYKRNLVWSGGSAGGKMFFALLTEVITFHVKPIEVDVRGFGLEFVSRSTFWCLKKFLKEVIHIFVSIPGNVKSRQNRKWSLGGSSRSFKSFEGSSKNFKSFKRSRFVDRKWFSWFLLLDQLMRALEAWSPYAGRLCPQTEVISSNKVAYPLGMEILEL